MNNRRGTLVNVEAIDKLHFPHKAHETDAAYDLYTAERAEVKPNSRKYISLGFKIALPTNLALIIQPRSGQSGKGMIAYAYAPSWLGGGFYKIRINADSVIGLVDSQYGETVMAIVKFGRESLKHRIMRMLGFEIYVEKCSCIAQGRFVYVPDVNLTEGKVNGKRSGLGSTDR